MRRGPMRWGTNEMGDQWVGGTNEMGDQWNEWCMGANWGINEIGDQWDGGPMRWGTNEMGDQWDGGPMMCTRHSPFRIHDIVTVRWTNRKMSMGYQGSLVWNIIAKHIDMNCSVDTFKKRLKNYTWKTENAIRVGAWVLDTSTRSAQVPDLNFSTRTVLLVLRLLEWYALILVISIKVLSTPTGTGWVLLVNATDFQIIEILIITVCKLSVFI